MYILIIDFFFLNFVYRDIKPENFLMKNKREKEREYNIKLIDFGFAAIFHKGKNLEKYCGSPYYMAPEVLNKKYGPECDMWSLGVTIFYMMYEKYPFDDERKNKRKIFEKIRAGKFT